MTTVAPARIERLTIPFSGPGAGTGPVTWGQRQLLKIMRDSGWAIDSSGAYPVAPGTTVADMVERVRGMMSRHTALRMRLGTDADGQVCQVVSESGEIDIDLVTFDGDSERQDAVDYGNSLWSRWVVTAIDPYRQWPLRLTLIQLGDVLVYHVLTVGHLIADGTATHLLMAELGIGAPTGRPTDPPGMGTLELAHYQRTPHARRLGERSLRYWAEQLRSIPPLTFGEPTHPEGRLGKRFWRVRFGSPATYLAVLAIAARTRTDTSRVLLAVIATAVGRAAGVNPLTLTTVMSNRYRPGMARTIASVAGNAVFTLDLDGTVDDVVTRARQSSIVAGMNAFFAPDQFDELTARLDRERGYPAAVTCQINDVRLTSRPASEAAVRGEPVTTARIRAALPESFLTWESSLDYMLGQVFISVQDVPDTVHLRVMIDLGCFTEEQAEAMLRGVEEVAVAAAFDPTAPTMVAPGHVAVD